jgi:hypothetical protein
LEGKCPNSDIENLELEHRGVSKSHRVITRNCTAFDPPIDAAASMGFCTALVPRRGRPFFNYSGFRVT